MEVKGTGIATAITANEMEVYPLVLVIRDRNPPIKLMINSDGEFFINGEKTEDPQKVYDFMKAFAARVLYKMNVTEEKEESETK